jgi:sigma-B regulation protein RsbU (phosphoserine phosphatase)
MLLREVHLSLLDVVKELNRLMCESTAPERFITAAFAVLNVEHQHLECVVCGHPNPIVVSPEKPAILIESTGIPLGIIPTFPFESSNYHLDPGSLVLLYTDGLSEAADGGKPLGEKGTIQLALKAAQRNGGLRGVLEELIGSERISIEDDITVLAFRING